MKHKSRSTLNAGRNQSNGSSNGKSSNTIMQQFDINAMAGTDSIAKSTVTLPVYERVNDDVAVNIILTPSKVTNWADVH